MPNKNTASVIEMTQDESDEILLAPNRTEERRKRAAALVALNYIPADTAIRTLAPTKAEESAPEIRDLLAASLEEDDQPFEFIPPKLKIAPGGTTRMMLDSGEFFAEVTGVIAISQIVRAYWPSKEPSNMPPLCTSHDGKHGYFSDLNDDGQMQDAQRTLFPHPAIGLLQERGEEFPEFFTCKGCPMNVWASDPAGGRGKACKERRRLLLILDGFQSPVIFSLPPTSVRQFDMFASGLKAQGLSYFAVRVSISLSKQQSGGYTYGVANFHSEGMIESMAEAQAVVSIRQQYADLIRTMPIQSDEFSEVKVPF